MKIINFIIFLLLAFSTFGQTATFNKRLQIGCANTIFTGLEVTDSCYYLTGIVRDTSNCKVTALFAKSDTFGAITNYTMLPTINGIYQTWNPCLHTNFNNDLVVSTFFLDSIGMKGGILKYNAEGNLIWSSLHHNPYTTNDFIRPDDMKVTPDSGYILVNSVDNPIEASDISILKTDKNGHQQWHITRGVTNYVENWGCIYLNMDSSFVIGYQQDNLSGVLINYTVRCIIEKIDSIGNTIWTWQSPPNMQITGANDLIKTKDGGWVVATGIGTEIISVPGVFSRFVTNGYVFKLDSARNFLWGKKMENYFPSTLSTMSRILELEDSSLMAFGAILDTFIDTNLDTFSQHNGYVVKLSPQGDSLWSHQYQYLQQYSAEHEIFDVERTYDGGFLVCGQSILTGQGAVQQGWLLKLDEYGCLVPGCHLPLGVLSVGADSQVEMTLYPNPTTDYLNVHYRNRIIKQNLTFSVVDMQGRVLQHYTTTDVSDKTYIVPVYDLTTGMYVLEVRRDGQLLKSEQFIKN